MRGALQAFILGLMVLSAGCTSDGNLGGLDAPTGTSDDPAKPAESQIWSPAHGSHGVLLDARAKEVVVEGATVEGLPSVTFAAQSSSDSFSAGLSALALEDVTVEGERGWLVLPLVVELAAFEGAWSLAAPLATRGSQVVAMLPAQGELGPLVTRPFWCEEEPRADEPAECAEWRESRPPPVPSGYQDRALFRVTGASLPPSVSLVSEGATFHGGESSRPLPPGTVVDASGGTFWGIGAEGESHVFGSLVEVSLGSSGEFVWQEGVTVGLREASGAVDLVGRSSHPLDAFRDVVLRVRTPGTGALAREGDSWRVAPMAGEATTLSTDGVHRLGASMRLVPEIVEARGPANNTTRVQLVLAETSFGADAQLKGYRIDPSVKARYEASQPFQATEQLFELINNTEGPITPVMVLGVGVTLPFVAILEGFVGFLTALFPPSLAGPLSAGEASIVSFLVVMPESEQEVDILIEAENAEPVRATLRLVPEG